MPDVDLKFALGLPPEKAIKYFQDKGYKFSWDWHETWQEAHHKAFTVAKVMRADILQDIRNEMDKAISEGKGYKEFEKNLEPMLKAKGWWGKKTVMDENGFAKQVQLGSPHRLKLIYDTNKQIAFMQGRYQTQLDAAPLKPYWKYVTRDDSKVRLSHRTLHGKVFRFDDPFWDHFYPPNGFRCRCRVETLSQRQLDNANLKVQSSEGKLETIENKIGNKSYQTTVFKAQRKVSPDPGWDYNPGKKTGLQPDLSAKKYEPKIERQLKKALSDKNIQYAKKLETKEQLTKWTDENVKIPIKNINNADLQNAKEYIDAVAIIEKEHQITIPATIEFDVVPQNAWAYYDKNRKAIILPLTDKNILSEMKKTNILDGIHTKKESIPFYSYSTKLGLIAHEVAHSLDWNNYYSNLILALPQTTRNKIKKLSKQAKEELNIKAKQAFAESFASYIENNPRKQFIPQEIIDIILLAIKEN